MDVLFPTVTGNKVYLNGKILRLKGVNIPDPQHLNNKINERPNISAKTVASTAVLKYSAKVIRIPVLPGEPKYPTEGWFSPTNGREKYFQYHLDPLVKYLTEQKIYSIIDLHYIKDYTGLFPKVSEFWSFIAPRYKDNPYVIFEIFNEPIYPDNWDQWKNEIAQPTVNLIRQLAPNNLIIVGAPFWTSHVLGAVNNPIVGTNIIYAAHIYPNQSAVNWDRDYKPIADRYPLFITEWGYQNESNPSSTSRGTTSGFGIPFMKWLDQKQLSWTAWTFDCIWTPRMFNSTWSLLGGENWMGDFVKAQLGKIDPIEKFLLEIELTPKTPLTDAQKLEIEKQFVDKLNFEGTFLQGSTLAITLKR